MLLLPLHCKALGSAVAKGQLLYWTQRSRIKTPSNEGWPSSSGLEKASWKRHLREEDLFFTGIPPGCVLTRLPAAQTGAQAAGCFSNICADRATMITQLEQKGLFSPLIQLHMPIQAETRRETHLRLHIRSAPRPSQPISNICLNWISSKEWNQGEHTTRPFFPSLDLFSTQSYPSSIGFSFLSFLCHPETSLSL